jgi:two-component system, NarL family, response regulator YdfI
MLGRVRVLLADDFPEVRELLRRHLELDGRFEIVGEAANGIDAVDLVGELYPDVVILDLALPEMDGLAAIAKLRRNSPGTKILVLSAFSEDEHSGVVDELGANGFITKDRPIEEIVHRILEIAGLDRPAS